MGVDAGVVVKVMWLLGEARGKDSMTLELR